MRIEEGWCAFLGLAIFIVGIWLGSYMVAASVYAECLDVGKLSLNGGVVECRVTVPRPGRS